MQIVFHGAFKKKFKKQFVGKPEAIRKGSREVYVVGLEFKGTPKKKAPVAETKKAASKNND